MIEEEEGQEGRGGLSETTESSKKQNSVSLFSLFLPLWLFQPQQNWQKWFAKEEEISQWRMASEGAGEKEEMEMVG